MNPHRLYEGTLQERNRAAKKAQLERIFADPERLAVFKARRDRNNHAATLRRTAARRATQHGVCELCDRYCPNTDKRTGLVRDHDHKTGKVRGFLCQRCNTGLGKFGDDPQMLAKAIAYLRRDVQ